MTESVGPSGLLPVDKQSGMTSHDVVTRARRLLGTRRIGHAGTLDPAATGLLVIAVGRMTRLLGYLASVDKQYVATIRLGQWSTTDDADGELTPGPSPLAGQRSGTARRELPGGTPPVTETGVDAGLAALTGTIGQRPSAISAVKIGGERAHRLVRRGENVELPIRTVTVSRLDRCGPIRTNDRGDVDLDIRVMCSTGTYVRALARDLGDDLGLGGHVVSLRRTAVGPVDVGEAPPWRPAAPAEGDGDLLAAELIPGAVFMPRFLPAVILDDDEARAAVNGLRIPADLDRVRAPSATSVAAATEDPVHVLLGDGGQDLVAMADVDDQGRWRYRTVLGRKR